MSNEQLEQLDNEIKKMEFVIESLHGIIGNLFDLEILATPKTLEVINDLQTQVLELEMEQLCIYMQKQELEERAKVLEGNSDIINRENDLPTLTEGDNHESTTD